MTIFSKNLGGHGPFSPPAYAYALMVLTSFFASLTLMTCYCFSS